MNSQPAGLHTERSVMIVAGEASGDHYGAQLASALRRKITDVRIRGIGGREMRKTGTEILVDAETLSVVGITEVFVKIPTILRAMKRIRREMRLRRPDLLILIDFPDFNLRLAAFARQMGIPVLYYISPQIWAWRSGRVRTIGKRVDHMAVILPFELPFYRKHRIPVTFVGHPLLDKPESYVRRRFSGRFSGSPVIGLLPGSRDSEVSRMLPVMLEASGRLSRRIPGVRFLLSVSPSVDSRLVRKILDAYEGDAEILPVEGSISPVLEQSRFVIAVSGTVTLETALAGVPLAVIYKVSPASYRLGRMLIRVPCISLVNLISGKSLVPELIQEDASPENIAETAGRMLEDLPGLVRVNRELLEIRKRMGGPGAADRVANIAVNLIASRPKALD